MIINSVFIGIHCQDCCDIPFKVQSSGRIDECTAYFAQQNCTQALCGSCTDSNIMFVADPNCFYPC